MAKISLKQLREENPVRLNVFWCDRCKQATNADDERDHFGPEQCDGWKMFRAIDGDFGYCSSYESVYGGRLMSEHDTCSRWHPEKR